MSVQFASGKHAIAICDRCGFTVDYKKLKSLTVNRRKTGLLVCEPCWEEDHPQYLVGKYPVVDPQGLRNARPDNSYVQSGLNAGGYPGGGSRDIQWGWNPVGLYNPLSLVGLENDLEASASVGTVTVTTS